MYHICTDIKGKYMFFTYTYNHISRYILYSMMKYQSVQRFEEPPSHAIMSCPGRTSTIGENTNSECPIWTQNGHVLPIDDVFGLFQHELVHTWSSFLIDDVWCPNVHQKGQHQNQNLFARKKGSLSVDGGLPQNPVTVTDCPHIVSILSCYQGWSHRFLIPSSECATIQGTLALATCVVSILYSWNGWETGLGKTLL